VALPTRESVLTTFEEKINLQRDGKQREALSGEAGTFRHTEE